MTLKTRLKTPGKVNLGRLRVCSLLDDNDSDEDTMNKFNLIFEGWELDDKKEGKSLSIMSVLISFCFPIETKSSKEDVAES